MIKLTINNLRIFKFTLDFQMDELDTLSEPDIPYPYEMIWRFNKERVNSFLPKSFVQNKLWFSTFCSFDILYWKWLRYSIHYSDTFSCIGCVKWKQSKYTFLWIGNYIWILDDVKSWYIYDRISLLFLLLTDFFFSVSFVSCENVFHSNGGYTV